MTPYEIASLRFINQHLAKLLVHSPEQDVRELVAVQSQDFAGAKWGLRQRMEGFTLVYNLII